MAEYKQQFSVIPSDVLALSGCTASYLRIYETIFQFWNHKKKCFLSNRKIMERTGKSIATIKRAFQFFERHGVLQRATIKERRHLVQPTIAPTGSDLSLDGSSLSPTSSEMSWGGLKNELGGAQKRAHNINNINKDEEIKREREQLASPLFDELHQKQLNDTPPTLLETAFLPPLPSKNSTESMIYSGNKRTTKFFDEIWAIYPQKQKVEEARELWSKMNLDDHVEDIRSGIEHHIERNPQWQNTRYVPHFINFLSGKRWKEKIETNFKPHSGQQGREGNVKRGEGGFSSALQHVLRPAVAPTSAAYLEWGPGHPGWESLHRRKQHVAHPQ